jgi:hypothetical protein
MSACIFCGGRANTREHAWPEWAIESLGHGRDIQVWLGPDAKRKAWPVKGRSSHLRVKQVCAKCNNGWLSVLENTAKPVLSPMMHDLSIPLSREQQWLIAVWTIKTAMVFDCTNPQGRFYTKGDVDHLLTRFAPPLSTAIWLGRFERSSLLTFEGRYLSPRRREGGAVLDKSLVASLSMARLAIQVLSIRWDANYQPAGSRVTIDLKPGPWNRSLIQIWPTVSPVHWPPPLSISEDGLETLNQRFTNP